MNKYKVRATNVSKNSAYAIAKYVLKAKVGTRFDMDVEDAGTYTISLLLEAENELPVEVADGIMTGVVQQIVAVTMKEDHQETDETPERKSEDGSQTEGGEAADEAAYVDYKSKNENPVTADDIVIVDLPEGKEDFYDGSEPVVEMVTEEPYFNPTDENSAADDVVVVDLSEVKETSGDGSEPVVEVVVEEPDFNPKDENHAVDDAVVVDLSEVKETSDDRSEPVVDAIDEATEEPSKVDPLVQLNGDIRKAETVEDIVLAIAVYIGYDEDATEKLRMLTNRFANLMKAGEEVTWANAWKKIKGVDPIKFDPKKKYIFKPILTKPFREVKKGVQFPTFIKNCIQKSLYWRNVQESKTSSGVTQKEDGSAEGGVESK